MKTIVSSFGIAIALSLVGCSAESSDASDSDALALANSDGALSSNDGWDSTSVRRVQAALGVAVTGELGPDDGPTRNAIREFERGMIARRAAEWTVTGKLTGPTGRQLTALVTAMPTELASPFERALIANGPDELPDASMFSVPVPFRMSDLWMMLAPGEPDPVSCTGDACLEASGAMKEPMRVVFWQRIRERLAAERTKRSLGAGRSDLDSQLYSSLHPTP